MDDQTTRMLQLPTLTDTQAKREWLIGVWGASICYGLILWLC